MKVIFFDIDGTLTDFHHNVPASAAEGIRRTREKGNKVALCSGRSENQIGKEIIDIGFDAIVSAAGAMVSVGGKTIFSATIEKADYEFLQKTLVGRVPDYAVQTAGEVYLSVEELRRMDEYEARVTGRPVGKQKTTEELIENARRAIGNIVITDDYSAISNPQKLFYHSANATVEEVEEALDGRFTVQQLSFGPPNPYAGEITLKGMEKSTGMAALMKYYGLDRGDSVAFGDGPNDMDMIEYAGLSICMGNGREELKAAADYVTANAEDDGIYQALDHFGLL